MSDYEDGLYSNQPKSNFQDGSQEWAGAQAAEMMRARQAEWDRQRAEQIRGDISARGATTSARVATGSGEAGGGVVALEGYIPVFLD